MRPFNLEQAKAGKALITREGRICTFIAHVPEERCEDCRIIIFDTENKTILMVSEEGKYWPGDAMPNDNDVMMQSEKITRWVNVYPGRPKGYPMGDVLYQDKKDAERMCLMGGYPQEIVIEI